MEIEGSRIKGTYLGKMFSRREKIYSFIKAFFYGLLGRAFLGSNGYTASAFASPSMEIK